MNFEEVFTPELLQALFPRERADIFFEALFGDASEGAYDISLHFSEKDGNDLAFELHLKERPGKCLRCNLTYGLPEVFSRHPAINLQGLAEEIVKRAADSVKLSGWQLGATREISRKLHVIPLTITLAS